MCKMRKENRSMIDGEGCKEFVQFSWQKMIAFLAISTLYAIGILYIVLVDCTERSCILFGSRSSSFCFQILRTNAAFILICISISTDYITRIEKIIKALSQHNQRFRFSLYAILSRFFASRFVLCDELPIRPSIRIVQTAFPCHPRVLYISSLAYVSFLYYCLNRIFWQAFHFSADGFVCIKRIVLFFQTYSPNASLNVFLLQSTRIVHKKCYDFVFSTAFRLRAGWIYCWNACEQCIPPIRTYSRTHIVFIPFDFIPVYVCKNLGIRESIQIVFIKWLWLPWFWGRLGFVHVQQLLLFLFGSSGFGMGAEFLEYFCCQQYKCRNNELVSERHLSCIWFDYMPLTQA